MKEVGLKLNPHHSNRWYRFHFKKLIELFVEILFDQDFYTFKHVIVALQ